MLSYDRRLPLLCPAPAEAATLGTIPLDALHLSPTGADTALRSRDRGRGRGRRRPRTVVVTEDAATDPLLAERLAALAYSGVQIRRARDHYERQQRRVLLEELDHSWFLFDRPLRAHRAYAAIKRLVDVLAGLIGVVLVGLMVPVLWVAVQLDDKGPLFYRQERIGRGGKAFRICKFRTMATDAEAAGPRWAKADDDRITRVGRFLRRTRLDEFPQFWNVLRGEMTLVGPRPERATFVATLSQAIPFYERRHYMRPGITGWATVRFGYGDSVSDKWHSHEYDLYYLKHRSIRLDAEILVRTCMVMLLRRGQ